MPRLFLLFPFLLVLEAVIIAYTAEPSEQTNRVQPRATQPTIWQSEPPSYDACVLSMLESAPVNQSDRTCSSSPLQSIKKCSWLQHLGLFKPFLFLVISIAFACLMMPSNSIEGKSAFMFMIFTFFLMLDVVVFHFKAQSQP